MNWYKFALLNQEKIEKEWNSKVLECKIINNYQLCLVDLAEFKNTKAQFQISINTLDTDASSEEDQNKKIKYEVDKSKEDTVKNIKTQLIKWIGQYKIICITSMNTDKAKKYTNILRYITKGSSIKMSIEDIQMEGENGNKIVANSIYLTF